MGGNPLFGAQVEGKSFGKTTLGGLARVLRPIWVVWRTIYENLGDLADDVDDKIDIWVFSRFGSFGGRFGWFRVVSMSIWVVSRVT